MNANDAVPTIWTTGNTEVFKTGTWRSALPQHIRAPSPCHAACPVNGDIAEWTPDVHMLVVTVMVDADAASRERNDAQHARGQGRCPIPVTAMQFCFR